MLNCIDWENVTSIGGELEVVVVYFINYMTVCLKRPRNTTKTSTGENKNRIQDY